MRAPYLIRFARLLSFSFCSAGLFLLCSLHAQTEEKRLDYKVGERARETIRATETIRVTDPEKHPDAFTEIRGTINPVFGYSKESTPVMKEAFSKSWNESRGALLDALERDFGKRGFQPEEIRDEAFSIFIDAYRETNTGYPVSDELARRWASGNPGDYQLKQHLARLENFSTAYFIRDDETPGFPSAEIETVDLITLPAGGPPSLDELEKMPFAKIPFRQLIPLARAREVFEMQTGLANRAVKAYLGQFIQPNTTHLEGLSIERWEAAQRAVQREKVYEAGDVIVREGEEITPLIKEALDILAVNLRFSRLRNEVRIELAKEPGLSASGKVEADSETGASPSQAATPATDTPAPQKTKETKTEGKLPPALSPVTVADSGNAKNSGQAKKNLSANPAPSAASTIDGFYLWLIGLSLAVLVGILVILHFRKKPPVYIRDEQTPAVAEDDRRLLIKALGSQLTQTLFRQRQTLLRSKEQATAQVAAMENRLAKLQPEIFDKLQAYESKIKELEERLQDQGVSLQSLDKPLVSNDPAEEAYPLFNDLPGTAEGEGKSPASVEFDAGEEEKEVPFPGSPSDEDLEAEAPGDLMEEIKEDLEAEKHLDQRIARGGDK